MNANEQLMIEKARSLFGVPDSYWNSVYGGELVSAAVDRLITSTSGSNDRSLGVTPEFWKNLRRASRSVTSISTLRPIWGENGGNVLGRVWDTVLELARREVDSLDQVAVGVIPQLGLGAQAFQNQMGAKAILVSDSLFLELYSLNHALLALLNVTGASEERRQTARRVLEEHLSRLAGVHCVLTAELDYGSAEEFVFVDRITDAQRQFVLLHEVGHFALSHFADLQTLSSTRKEAAADQWAIRLLLGAGRRFHIPEIQWTGLHWLLEFCAISERHASEESYSAVERLRSIFETVEYFVDELDWKRDPRVHQTISDCSTIIQAS